MNRYSKIIIGILILSLLLFLIAIVCMSPKKQTANEDNYDEYSCLISDKNVENFYFEENQKNYSFKLLKMYYFKYKNNTIADGLVEISCIMNSKKDFDSFSCLSLKDLPYYDYETDESKLTQTRISKTVFTKDFTPDENDYINSYIKYLEADGFRDCKKIKKRNKYIIEE